MANKTFWKSFNTAENLEDFLCLKNPLKDFSGKTKLSEIKKSLEHKKIHSEEFSVQKIVKIKTIFLHSNLTI